MTINLCRLVLGEVERFVNHVFRGLVEIQRFRPVDIAPERLQAATQIARHRVEHSLPYLLVGQRVFFFRFPVNGLFEAFDVHELNVAIARLAALKLVYILSLELEAIEIRQFGWSTDTAELLHHEVDLLSLELAHIADYLRKLLHSAINIHTTEDENAVGCVTG